MRTIAYDELTPDVAASVKLWGHKDAERLTADDIDQAVEEYLNGADLTDGTLAMQGFVPMSLPAPDRDVEWVLEALLERWDEDLGDPEDRPTTPTATMVAAATEFVKAIQAEYRVWACEPVIAVNVPIRPWIVKHRPDWLASPAGAEHGLEKP